MTLENKTKYYSSMSKEELIGYCDEHCRTPRALFPRAMIAQMVEYAGRPDGYSTPEEFLEGIEWYSWHDEMEKLVKLARENKN